MNLLYVLQSLNSLVNTIIPISVITTLDRMYIVTYSHPNLQVVRTQTKEVIRN